MLRHRAEAESPGLTPLREEDRELIPRQASLDHAPSRAPDNVILVDSTRQLVGSFGGWVVAEHYPEPVRRDIHQAYEIGVLLQGKQVRYFEDFQTALNPGDLYLSPAWEGHGWQTAAPDTYTMMIHFLPDFLGEEGFEGTSWLSLFALPPEARPYPKTAHTRQRIFTIVHDLITEIAEGKPGWMAGARLHVLNLLFTVWREWQPPQPEGGQRTVGMGDLGRLSPAIDLVRSRRNVRTSLREAAESCSLSRSQFSALFRKTMGLSFGQFVSRYRALKTAELLLSTDLSLQQIARELGFLDAAHLHRAFTKHYGCTPGRYRKGKHPADVLPSRRGAGALQSVIRALRSGDAPVSARR